jgi:hypothetical protein
MADVYLLFVIAKQKTKSDAKQSHNKQPNERPTTMENTNTPQVPDLEPTKDAQGGKHGHRQSPGLPTRNK